MANSRSEKLDRRVDATTARMADALAAAGLDSATLAELEAAAIHNALKQCDENRTYAARRLGISVRTLQRKLRTGD